MTKVTITSAALGKAVEAPSLAAAEMNAAIGKKLKPRRRTGKTERAAPQENRDGPVRAPSALSISGQAVSALVEAKIPLDNPSMVAAIAIHGGNWLDRMLGGNQAPPAGISPLYAARRAEALSIWKLDMGSGALADYHAELTGDAYTDACIAHVELCRARAEAAFTALQNTRATSHEELCDKEILLGAYNGEPDKPDWYRADVAGLTVSQLNQAPSASIAALADQMGRLWAVENAIYERGHTDEEREEAVQQTGAAAHQLMALPSTSLADFRAKARAVEWALCGGWDTWPSIGTFGDFAKSLILELIGDARVRIDESPEVAPSAWASADARRTRLRAKLQALADVNDDLSPAENDELSQASIAFIREPAPDLGAMLRKAEQELIDDAGVHTIEQALAQLDEGDIHDAWKASVYRDLQRLIWDQEWAGGYQLSEKLAEDLPLLNDIEASLKTLDKARRSPDTSAAHGLYSEYDTILDRILSTRAQTIAAMASKVTMIETVGADLTVAPDGDLDLELKIVRSLLEDVKAMFRAPEVSITGSKACTALWTAAAIKARYAKAPELLAAE